MTAEANEPRVGRTVEAARRLTPARIVALALIAVAICGLAYLRFAPEPEPMSVAMGARAGDLRLKPCSYATENGSYAADCGTLVVPENRANPSSRLIALPVVRIRARSEQHSGEPIFYLEGGPGLSNMTFPYASRYADDRDVVLVGYRGLDGSVRLDCPEVASALRNSADLLGEESFRAYGDAYRACAARLTAEGVDLAVYGIPQQIDDFESARVALGYGQIDLLSQSAGTRTAMIYGWRYPESIHRSVMIGVNPPGNFLYDVQAVDEQIGRYAAACAKDAGCRARTDDLAASMRRTASNMPSRWLFLPIKASNVRIFASFGLPDSTASAAPLNSPTTLDAWLAAAEGDASGFWLQSLVSDLMPLPFVWGQYASAGRLDAQAARDYFSTGSQDRSSPAWVGSAFAWGGGRLADAWPTAEDEDAYSRVRTSNVETLLIGGALDTATPPQVATKELLPYLPNGHQVVLPGVGHIASVLMEQPDAGSHLINTFFASGRVDDSLYKPQTVDFTPTTSLLATAKMLAGVMVGLALLAVLSLLWMARRAHQCGGFGRKTSASLRSVFPLVLGLGGFCLGALVVLTAVPTVRLDSALLAVLSIGLPIGLGICLAWVHRDMSAESRAAGFASAFAGALVGAWLGFNATAGFLSLVTTIVGAALGANLTLVFLDISRDRSARDRFAVTKADGDGHWRPA